ncbi:hypothetical protein GOP47_0030373, partial [Adiantum capillus-veneris]
EILDAHTQTDSREGLHLSLSTSLCSTAHRFSLSLSLSQTHTHTHTAHFLKHPGAPFVSPPAPIIPSSPSPLALCDLLRSRKLCSEISIATHISSLRAADLQSTISSYTQWPAQELPCAGHSSQS